MPKAQICIAAAGTGEVPANPSRFDQEYVSPVCIGGQTLNLVFDTGSADLMFNVLQDLDRNDTMGFFYLFTSGKTSQNFRLDPPVQSTCQGAMGDTFLNSSIESRAGHNAYDNTKSRTFKTLQGSKWSITYGDGSQASGVVGTETVNIGGVTVTEQAIEMATFVSTQFVRDTNNDGLLGLSFSSINTVRPVPQKTFFDNAKPKLTAPVFTADLKHAAPGSYDFGFIGKAKFTGDMTFVPVNSSRGFWQFTASGHGIGSSFNPVPSSGIADTGTTLLLLDDTVVNAYYNAVPGAAFDPSQGGFTFPCENELPSFTVGIGSHMAIISGALMNFAPTNNGKCFGSLQSRAGIRFSIDGDILFRSQFVVFDGGNMSLGFANKP